MACGDESDRYSQSTQLNLRATHPVSPRSQRPHLLKPNIGRQCSQGSFPPHRGMRRDSIVRAKSLHRQTTDHQHNPPPPHHGFIYPCVQGLGPIDQTCKDVDRTPQDDPGSLPMKAQCDSPHCRPPRICPRPSIPAECVWCPRRQRFG